MDIPAEFTNRVYKTKMSGLFSDFEKMNQIKKSNPESDIDVVYENGKPIVVIVFPTQEDCLAYTLKYGTNYV